MPAHGRSLPFIGALSAQAASLGCLVVAYFKRDSAHVEGAYFNRADGEDAVALAWTSGVRPWLLAAMLLTVASAALWLMDHGGRR
jgi:hypothetical protein